MNDQKENTEVLRQVMNKNQTGKGFSVKINYKGARI